MNIYEFSFLGGPAGRATRLSCDKLRVLSTLLIPTHNVLCSYFWTKSRQMCYPAYSDGLGIYKNLFNMLRDGCSLPGVSGGLELSRGDPGNNHRSRAGIPCAYLNLSEVRNDIHNLCKAFRHFRAYNCKSGRISRWRGTKEISDPHPFSLHFILEAFTDQRLRILPLKQDQRNLRLLRFINKAKMCGEACSKPIAMLSASRPINGPKVGYFLKPCATPRQILKLLDHF